MSMYYVKVYYTKENQQPEIRRFAVSLFQSLYSDSHFFFFLDRYFAKQRCLSRIAHENHYLST